MGGKIKLDYVKPVIPGKTQEEQVSDVIANTTLTTKDGKLLGTIPSIIKEDMMRKPKSVKDNMLEFMKIKEMAEINEYRRQMNFPAEASSTSTINIGSSGGHPADEETYTSNKGNTYNRSSKRDTRLVRVSKNG